MKRTLLGSAIAVALIGTSAADAQTYMMRQKIKQRDVAATAPVVGEWRAGSWGEWSSHCSDEATRIRAVSCVSNGSTVSDGSCVTADRPESIEIASMRDECPVDYSYGWEAGSWSDWSSHCSQTAVRTRSVYCVRSDGENVAASFCDAPPSSSETSAVVDACTQTTTPTAPTTPPPAPPATASECTPGIIGMSGASGNGATQDGVSLLSEGMTRTSGLSAWRVRNVNTGSRRVVLQSQSGGWSLTFVAPSRTDVYVVSGVGRVTHKLTAYGSNDVTVTGVQTKNANNSPFDGCR